MIYADKDISSLMQDWKSCTYARGRFSSTADFYETPNFPIFSKYINYIKFVY